MARALRIPTRREVADVVRLAWPIVVVQVGIMLMGVVDAAMLGRVSPTAMAAAALGNFYWMVATMIGQGTIMALDPLVAQGVGAGDHHAVGQALRRGLVVATGLTVASSLLLLPAEGILHALQQPADVSPLAGDYARISIVGTAPFFAFVALRQTLQAFKAMWPIVMTIVIANLANVVLDWALIFGHLGAPPMGVAGSAWATAASRWIMGLAILVAGWKRLRPYLTAPWRDAVEYRPLVALLRLGLPIGFHQWLEIAAFGGALVLMGLFGTIALAAHQIAITIIALIYMVPLGVSAAAAVLVGHAIGRGDAEGARREASAALVCSVGFMAVTAIGLIAFPHALARLFAAEGDVVSLAATLLPIAGAFQVFDGTQGVSSGILRGAGDTHIPMLLNFIGFVLVGIPAGLFLAFQAGLGPPGVWWGLLAALVAVATSLGWRVHVRLGGELARVHIR